MSINSVPGPGIRGDKPRQERGTGKADGTAVSLVRRMERGAGKMTDCKGIHDAQAQLSKSQ